MNRFPFGTRLRMLGVALLMMLGVTFVAPASPASATWNDPKVNLSGHIDCGGLDELTYVWYETSNDERGFARTEDWTSVGRWSSVARMFKWVKVRTYRVDLTKVSSNGSTITFKVGCRGALSGTVKEYKTSFGVQRPTFGRGATRHICTNHPLGCWV